MSLCRAAFNHDKKVLIAGVTRKGGRGIPACVMQQEETNRKRKRQLDVRGTVKAAVLDGDSGCLDLVAVSIYDTKPVHVLLMNALQIKWIVKLKMIYCLDTRKLE